ncbi:hypothetical protein AB0F42_32500 [Streptomyces buecherae]|uniref:hypothetical protein n=1 Tax=Streptomyces buecherae TaxID=2763006 RepID=UPI0033C72991
MTYATTRRSAMAGAALTSATLVAAASPRAAGAAGRVIEERRLDERLVALTPRSPALGRTIPVAPLAPCGWDRRRPGDRWATLYLLAGGDGRGVEDPYAIFGGPRHQWRVWLGWDPYDRADGLRDTPLYLGSGDGRPGPLDDEEPEVRVPGTEKWQALTPDAVVSVTEWVRGEETRKLRRRLGELGAPVATHIHPSTHTGAHGHRESRHALPLSLGGLRG